MRAISIYILMSKKYCDTSRHTKWQMVLKLLMSKDIHQLHQNLSSRFQILLHDISPKRHSCDIWTLNIFPSFMCEQRMCFTKIKQQMGLLNIHNLTSQNIFPLQNAEAIYRFSRIPALPRICYRSNSYIQFVVDKFFDKALGRPI